MRIFKFRAFHKWAKKINLTDVQLKHAVIELMSGQYEAFLGGGIYKKRIALPGKGKRGSLRTIIAFKRDKTIFYLYGFSKNKRANIRETEKIALKKLAKSYFLYNEFDIQNALRDKDIIEVSRDG